MSTPLSGFFRSRFGGAGVSALFAPRKPRHPMMRLVFGLVGVALLLALLVVGVFVGVAMLIGGVLLRLSRRRGKPVARDHRIVDGEYQVVSKAGQPLLR